MRGGRGTYPAQKGIKRARNRCGFKLAVVGERELDSAVSNQGKREKRKAQQQTETEPETKTSTLFLLVYFVFRGADGACTAQTQGVVVEGEERCCCIRRLFGGAFSPYRTKGPP